MEGTRLLLVEDDLATLFALRSLFGRFGCEVSTARTVAEATAQLRSAAPGWVVLDLGLPDGDGEEILRLVRENALATRVAVISGSLDDKRTSRLQAWKPDLVMAKPIDFARLCAACLNTDPTTRSIRDLNVTPHTTQSSG